MGKKDWIIVVLTLAVVGLLAAGAYLLYPTRFKCGPNWDAKKQSDLMQKAQTFCTRQNVDQVYLGDGYVKVVGSLLGAGSSYYPTDGGEPIVCPIVSPDFQSAECKRMYVLGGWKKVCDGSARQSNQLEQTIKELFAQKYNKRATDVLITLENEDDSHARGGVRFVGEEAGAIFLAAVVDGKWTLVHDGNGQIPCSLSKYGFPAEMIDDCSSL